MKVLVSAYYLFFFLLQYKPAAETAKMLSEIEHQVQVPF